MVDAARNDVSCPEAVLALIPWYPDGALSTSERSAVEAHAATCAACRDEIHALLGGFTPAPDVEMPSAAKVLARVLDRIDRAESAATVRPAVSKPAPRPSTAARRRPGFARRLGLAASLAAAASLGAFVTWSTSHPSSGDVYRTAASSEATANTGPVLEIIPRDEISVAEFRAALRRIEGEIVGGPQGTLGRYHVRLPAGADAAAAAALLKDDNGGIASYAEALQL